MGKYHYYTHSTCTCKLFELHVHVHCSTYQTKQITIIAMIASIMRNMTIKTGTRMYARFTGVDISGIEERKEKL